MISSSYKLQEEKEEAGVTLHPTWSSLLAGLGGFYLRRITRSASHDSFSTP